MRALGSDGRKEFDGVTLAIGRWTERRTGSNSENVEAGIEWRKADGNWAKGQLVEGWPLQNQGLGALT